MTDLANQFRWTELRMATGKLRRRGVAAGSCWADKNEAYSLPGMLGQKPTWRKQCQGMERDHGTRRAPETQVPSVNSVILKPAEFRVGTKMQRCGDTVRPAQVCLRVRKGRVETGGLPRPSAL